MESLIKSMDAHGASAVGETDLSRQVFSGLSGLYRGVGQHGQVSNGADYSGIGCAMR